MQDPPEGRMPAPAAVARDSVALLLAAMRDDQTAVAVLLNGFDRQHACDVAVFCAYTASQQFAALETARGNHGHYTGVLRSVALQLAGDEAPPTTR